MPYFTTLTQIYLKQTENSILVVATGSIMNKNCEVRSFSKKLLDHEEKYENSIMGVSKLQHAKYSILCKWLATVCGLVSFYFLRVVLLYLVIGYFKNFIHKRPIIYLTIDKLTI